MIRKKVFDFIDKKRCDREMIEIKSSVIDLIVESSK